MVEAGLHLGGVGGLLVAGGGELGEAVGGLGLLALGAVGGVLGELALHLEVFLGGGEPVEQVGVAGVLDLEEGPLLGGLAGVVGVEGGEGVVGGRVHEGLDGELADLVAEQRDLGGLGLDGRGGLGEGGLAPRSAARRASTSIACWPATLAARASRAASTWASVAWRASTWLATWASWARTRSRSAEGSPFEARRADDRGRHEGERQRGR